MTHSNIGIRLQHGWVNDIFFLAVSAPSNNKINIFKWDRINHVFTNNMSSFQTIIPYENGNAIRSQESTFCKVKGCLLALCVCFF